MRRRVAILLAAFALLGAWLALPVPADMAGGFGPSAAAGGVSSGTAALEPDNAVVSSSTLLEITAWDTVALAPIFSSTLTYDAALGTLPDAQGWTLTEVAGSPTITASGGVLTVTNPGSSGVGADDREGTRYERTVASATNMIVRADGWLCQYSTTGSATGNLALHLRDGVGGLGANNFDGAAAHPFMCGLNDDDTTFDSTANIFDSFGLTHLPDYDFTVSGTLECRYDVAEAAAQNRGLCAYYHNGRFLGAHSPDTTLQSTVTEVRFAFSSTVSFTTENIKLTTVRAVAGATVYSAASPTADVVIDLGAGNTGVWDMSTILSDEREGAGALRYRYEAGAADPGAGDPLNGADLTLAALRAESDPSGRFLRFRVVFPSDGTASQPRAWGGGSIAWTIP